MRWRAVRVKSFTGDGFHEHGSKDVLAAGCGGRVGSRPVARIVREPSRWIVSAPAQSRPRNARRGARVVERDPVLVHAARTRITSTPPRPRTLRTTDLG